jgi:hypothetical protein
MISSDSYNILCEQCEDVFDNIYGDIIMNILKNIARKVYQLKTSYFPNNTFIMDNNIHWPSMFFIIYNSNIIYEINFCDDGTSIMTKKMLKLILIVKHILSGIE